MGDILENDLTSFSLACNDREVPGSSPRLSKQFKEERVMSPREVPGLDLTCSQEAGSSWSEDEEFDALGKRSPPGLRLPPLGQDCEDENSGAEGSSVPLEQKVRQMEEEQEQLTSSLMAMTSHYAKVQLRLQQIVGAPADSREQLLKDLEQFAFRGIPDVISKPANSAGGPAVAEPEDEKQKAVEEQRRKQAEAIEQLRGQLEELESYAYQAGEAAIPSRVLLDRQRVVMEQLRARLNLNVEDLAKLSDEQLKAEVDSAVGQIVNPLKMKSQLVSQLQTQISDLEMFIQFLQEESSVKVPLEHGCGCDKHEEVTAAARKGSKMSRKLPDDKQQSYSDVNSTTIKVLKRAIEALQTSSVISLGCGSGQFHKNTLKSTKKGSHYGDLRAKLEYAVEHLLDVCSNTDSQPDDLEGPAADSADDDDNNESSLLRQETEFLIRSPEVTAIVRKEVAAAIRDLMHHGLGQESARSLLPFSGCMSARAGGRSRQSSMLHAWDVVLKFYEMKGGAEFNSAPQRRLSHSFGLDLVGTPGSNKQVLLHTIGQIIASHAPYKRSPDKMFKALISAGLNKRKLVAWLRLIIRNQTILEVMYQPWSYAVTTGFDDAFRLLERLSLYVFDLPVNIAVKQFQEMKDAF